MVSGIKNENIYYVYIHRRNDTNEVFYVGKGKGNRFKDKYSRNKWWLAIVDKYGFTWEIIERELYEDDAFDLEVELIKFYRECGCSLSNMTNGGEGLGGRVVTPETRAKMSAAGKRKTFSDITRSRLSLAGVGRGVSQETRDKISKSKTGQKMSNEVANMRSLTAKRTPVACSNGMCFVSMLAAGQWLVSTGLSKGKYSTATAGIRRCCKGLRETVYGLKWSYMSKEIMEQWVKDITYELKKFNHN